MVVFEIYGDSNISRSWKAVASESERLKGSVLRSTTSLVLLKDTLRTVSQTTRLIIVSALSNPVSRINYTDDELTFQTDLVSLYDDILDCLTQTLNCNPDLQVLHFSIFSIFTKSPQIMILAEHEP
jgi:hypothetical protein